MSDIKKSEANSQKGNNSANTNPENRGPHFNIGAMIGLAFSIGAFALTWHLMYTHRNANSDFYTSARILKLGFLAIFYPFLFTGLGQVIWRTVFYRRPTLHDDEIVGEKIHVRDIVGEDDSGQKIDPSTVLTLQQAAEVKIEGIHWRGWTLGIVSIIFLSFIMPYIELYLNSTEIGIHHMPSSSLAIIFGLILGINGLLAYAYNSKKLNRWLGLRRSDLLTVFAMTMTTAGISVFYVMAYLIPATLTGRYLNKRGYENTVLSYFPKERNEHSLMQLTPKDPEQPDRASFVKYDVYLNAVKPYFEDGGILPSFFASMRQDYIDRETAKMEEAVHSLSERERRNLPAKVDAARKLDMKIRWLMSLGELPAMDSNKYIKKEYDKLVNLARLQNADEDTNSIPSRLRYFKIRNYIKALSSWLSMSDIDMLGQTPEEDKQFRGLVRILRLMAVSDYAVVDYAKSLDDESLKSYGARVTGAKSCWQALYGETGIAMPVREPGVYKNGSIDPDAYIRANASAARAYIRSHPDLMSPLLIKPKSPDELSDELALTLILYHWNTAHTSTIRAMLPPEILPNETQSVPWFRNREYHNAFAEYRMKPKPVEWAYTGAKIGTITETFIDENNQPTQKSTIYAEKIGDNKKKVYWFRLPWGAWFRPMLTWGVFLFSLWAMMVSTCALLRKQWADRERLNFPLAQVPIEMTEGIGKNGVGTFFTSKVAWVGMILPMLYHSWNIIPDFRAKWPSIPLVNHNVNQKYLTEPPWNRIGRMDMSLFPAVLGLTYLVSLEVSFSIWFFWLVEKTVGMIMAGAGLGRDASQFTGANGGIGSTFTDQGVGALFAMVLFGFYMGRSHLKTAIRIAIFGKKNASDDDSNEPLSYRVAILMLFLSFVILVSWLTVAGVPAHWAFIFISLFFLLLVGLTRLVAEGGLFFIQADVAPIHLMRSLATPVAIGAQGLTIMGVVHSALMFDLRAVPMPTIMNAFKFAGDGGIKRRHMGWAIMVALVLSSIFGFFGFMTLAYKYGMSNLEVQDRSWTLKTFPRNEYDKIRNTNQKLDAYLQKKKIYDKDIVEWERGSQTPQYEAGRIINRKLKQKEIVKSALTPQEQSDLDYYHQVGEKPAPLTDSERKLAKVDTTRAISLSIGVIVMILFMILRQRIFWWPHPIGYVVWMSPSAITKIVSSVFVGWFLKWAITKYGGFKAYYKMRKFFIGLIVGEAVIAIFWIIVKALLDMRGGYTIHIN